MIDDFPGLQEKQAQTCACFGSTRRETTETDADEKYIPFFPK